MSPSRLTGKPYELSRSAALDDGARQSSGRVLAVGRPLAPRAGTGGRLLTEFGTQPVPAIRDFVDDDGFLVVELDADDVGRRHAVSAFVAELFPSAVPRARQGDEPTFGTTGYVKAPIELWVVDVLAPEGLFGPSLPVPRAYMVTNLRGKPVLLKDIASRHAKQVVARPPVAHLGKGPAALETPDVPRYPAMVESVCHELGWDAAAFHVLRCRVEYPVMPSSIVIGFDLPERLASGTGT